MYYYILEFIVKDKYKHITIIFTIILYILTYIALCFIANVHIAMLSLICISMVDKYYLSIIRNTIDIDIMKYLDTDSS